MNLDQLAHIAQKNGGKATMPMSSYESSAEQERNYQPPMSNVPQAQPPPKQTQVTPYSTGQSITMAPSLPNQIMQPLNVLAMMERDNHVARVLKESQKNCKEKAHSENIQNALSLLSTRQIIPPSTRVVSSAERVHLPHGIMQCAQKIANSTGLDQVGICVMIFGAIAIATWGRIKIRLDGDWTESTVGMLLQVSPAGTRKSAAVALLRKVFDLFCAEKNKGREETPKRGVDKVKKQADKIHNQALAALFKEDGITPSTIEQAKEIAEEHAKLTNEYFTSEQEKPPVKMLFDNTSTAALGKILPQQGEALGCIAAEGSLLKGNLLGKKAEPLLFNRLHTQEPYESAVRGQAISLKHPAFSVVNFVQASIASDFYSNTDLHDLGTTGRFIPYFHGGK